MFFGPEVCNYYSIQKCNQNLTYLIHVLCRHSPPTSPELIFFYRKLTNIGHRAHCPNCRSFHTPPFCMHAAPAARRRPSSSTVSAQQQPAFCFRLPWNYPSWRVTPAFLGQSVRGSGSPSLQVRSPTLHHPCFTVSQRGGRGFQRDYTAAHLLPIPLFPLPGVEPKITTCLTS